MNPSTTERNFTPISMGLASLIEGLAGVTDEFQIEQGNVRCPTLMVRPAPGVSVFTLSSMARDLMVWDPSAVGMNVKLHEVVPAARFQVVPPSTDTSTPATTPPTSLAVPVTVTFDPTGTVAPAAGEVMVEVGAVWSVEVVGLTSPAWSVWGRAPMSASMLAVACCMRDWGAPPSRRWLSSRPHAHWQVPVPHTSAPLAAR